MLMATNGQQKPSAPVFNAIMKGPSEFHLEVCALDPPLTINGIPPACKKLGMVTAMRVLIYASDVSQREMPMASLQIISLCP